MKKLWLLLAVPIVALDQWVKWWIGSRSVLFWLAETLPVTHRFIPGVDLTYAENTGAAFSILGSARWFLAATSALAAAAIVFAVCKGWVRRPLGIISISCVLGGAVGNLIDRLWRGTVIDMFEFTFVRFAIFNVADVFITAGGACFCLYLLLDARKSGASPREGLEPQDEDRPSAGSEELDNAPVDENG
ncbi:MAG: signal peptidase II [Oscillospiraceae bacterium]|jgi:signal peptidase II|nr:signal peptidase II [Oscillospiraceae bacterium]